MRNILNENLMSQLSKVQPQKLMVEQKSKPNVKMWGGCGPGAPLLGGCGWASPCLGKCKNSFR